MCDKKNKVLFTDSECLVLSPDFKLPDENHVLLRVHRQNNMYSFNLENIVPTGGLACLIAKATVDESNKWHRRLGHVNFKNLNKLVKGNLVRGLPSKIFQNDHTCVACQKGKQHKASCKAKVVFFLRTKDETSGILKNFIRQIENQLSQKVKTIRCDNGTEFKNKDIIEFCGSKGIKREYSNAKTPQQNGVAESKNKILIEAARTMLAYSFLPNTFWAKAVSTACYVLNRVLVTKPQNKTPYELITGKITIIIYIRPFGCHVTILNTIDHLGKFEEKSDEGFLIGYSLNSKAFRPVTAENKANKTAGLKEANHSTSTQDNIDAVNSEMEAEPAQEYFVLQLWSSYTSTVKSLEAKNGDEKPNGDTAKAFRKEFAQCTEDLVLQAEAARATSTNTVDTVSTPINTASPSRVFSTGGLDLTNNDQDDSQIHALKDIYDNPTDVIFTNASYDDEGTVTDFTNLETTVNVSPIPTSRILSIHPTTQIFGDPTSAVDAMQEELLQFKIQKVWILVDLPFGKKAIRTKWVYRNKKDERGVVVRNTARSVSQGYRQEEGIDYDAVFAPVARIEAIRIFLAFASYIGFILYQMDMKSAFLYGTIDEEVYVSQPPGFVDPKFPKKVYKVVKALYGLHQAPRAWYATLSTFLLKSGYRRGTIDKTLFIKKNKNDIMLVQKEDGIFISQDKYVADILKKFDFDSVKTASTPIETQKPLIKDEEAADLDVHLYRSMIGSLMYLTASRPDIMYLKGKPKLGLWYPRVSSFDLEAYSDSDYAGANLDRKSTTREAEYVTTANCCGIQCFTPKQSILRLGTTSLGMLMRKSLSSCISSGEAKWQVDLLYSLENDVKNTATSKTVSDASYIKAKVAGKTVSISEASIRQDLLFNDVDGIDCLTNQEIYENLQLMGTSWDQFPTNIASALICLATDRKFIFSKMIFEGMIRNLDAKKQFLMYQRFVQVFLNKQLSNLPAPLDNLPIPVLTKKVFTNMAKQGLHFSGHVTPLFPNMLAQAVVYEGEDPKENLEGTGGSQRDHVQIPHDSPLSGGHTSDRAEGGLNLDELLVLYTILSNRVLALETSKDAQAAEILNLKTRIQKLEKKCKPNISLHRAWLRSVSRLSRKKKLGKQESVSKQGRKNTKSGPKLDDSTFDDLDVDLAHGMDYIETEEAVNEGRQSNEIEELNLDAEDKGSGEKGGRTVSTARPEVGIARTDIDTARLEVHTANAPVSTAGVTISTVDPEVSAIEPPTTTSIFDDEDITMAQTLIKMKEEKAKEKGVAFKAVEYSSRPVRSITTLKPLPSIDPKDKGKGYLS
ncbi:putative ribonuclease H-like domain-containing protein [Tanacetum coccineum]|uniref:Ribonuclease H-like domain-containing protein n=1 Tax=Tanacetum coccineum TaxID=301880 RepID=A0ABQ4ZSX9_9ASTR